MKVEKEGTKKEPSTNSSAEEVEEKEEKPKEEEEEEEKYDPDLDLEVDYPQGTLTTSAKPCFTVPFLFSPIYKVRPSGFETNWPDVDSFCLVFRACSCSCGGDGGRLHCVSPSSPGRGESRAGGASYTAAAASATATETQAQQLGPPTRAAGRRCAREGEQETGGGRELRSGLFLIHFLLLSFNYS